MRYRTIVLLLLLSGTAFGQNLPIPSPHGTSNGMIWGNGTLFTGATHPINGEAVCNVNGKLVGCAGAGTAFAPQRVQISGNTTLTDCGSPLKCSYVLDMRSSATVTLPCSSDGEVVSVEVWQDTAGSTATFAGCNNYVVGQPTSFPAPALGSNAIQIYVWTTDLSTRVTPYYIFNGPGAQ